MSTPHIPTLTIIYLPTTKVVLLTEFLPLDLTSVIQEGLSKSKRAPDGLLHCSTDLCSPLRHVQLRAAGAPEKETDITVQIILETGTLWHKRIAQLLVDSGAPFMQEVSVTPWLPEGWAGTADWLFWHPDYSAFVLGDLKTIAGEGIAVVERGGIKYEHHHQLSAYWHALVSAGFPMLDSLCVMYFPKNRAKNYDTRPLVIEATPLSGEYMGELMVTRYAAVQDFLGAFRDSQDPNPGDDYLWDAEALEGLPIDAPQDRVLTLVWSRDHYDVKLVPHWTAKFCPYEDDLCDCSSQGETKVGEYKRDEAEPDHIGYYPRRGYTHIEPPELTHHQRRKFESG